MHSEKIFLDGVDFEFSLRARKNGFVLVKGKSFNSIDHNLNQDGDVTKIFGKSHVLFKIYPKSRFNNIINISFSLLIRSIVLFDILYSFELLKFLIFFISFQSLSRALKFLNEHFNFTNKK